MSVQELPQECIKADYIADYCDASGYQTSHCWVGKLFLHSYILYWLLAIFGPNAEVQFRTDAVSQQMQCLSVTHLWLRV